MMCERGANNSPAAQSDLTDLTIFFDAARN
jgi:hypothetical protein